MPEEIYIPLPFWFSRNPSMSIPYISIPSNTHINITFNSMEDIIINNEPPNDSDVQLPPGTEIAQPIPSISITTYFPNPEFQMENLQEGLRNLMLNGRHQHIVDLLTDGNSNIDEAEIID